MAADDSSPMQKLMAVGAVLVLAIAIFVIYRNMSGTEAAVPPGSYDRATIEKAAFPSGESQTADKGPKTAMPGGKGKAGIE